MPTEALVYAQLKLEYQTSPHIVDGVSGRLMPVLCKVLNISWVNEMKEGTVVERR